MGRGEGFSQKARKPTTASAASNSTKVKARSPRRPETPRPEKHERRAAQADQEPLRGLGDGHGIDREQRPAGRGAELLELKR